MVRTLKMFFQPLFWQVGLSRLGHRSRAVRYRTFRADSSSGKCPRLRVATRNRALSDSIPLVV